MYRAIPIWMVLSLATMTAGMLGSAPLAAQTVISADGVVESTYGGFKFPDGSIQTTAAVAGSAPVEDTGQQGCWDQDGNSISCSGTGQDGEVQAGMDWPAPRFTDNGDGTVTDNLTTLIWLKDANCPAAPKNWPQALDWVATFNGGLTACTDYTQGAFADWRLPNIKELLSLVDYGQSNPALPTGHPFVSVLPSGYWSSSSYVSDPANAWVLFVVSGQGAAGVLKTEPLFYVWPVRGGD